MVIVRSVRNAWTALPGACKPSFLVKRVPYATCYWDWDQQPGGVARCPRGYYSIIFSFDVVVVTV